MTLHVEIDLPEQCLSRLWTSPEDLPEQCLSRLWTSPEDFVQQMRLTAAIKWYEMDKIHCFRNCGD